MRKNFAVFREFRAFRGYWSFPVPYPIRSVGPIDAPRYLLFAGQDCHHLSALLCLQLFELAFQLRDFRLAFILDRLDLRRLQLVKS
jgi:hypothetical protein